ncbi:MAG: hypothetical protein CVV02_14215 [Firmicutes bacterium HGW-Firmicutes-7]|nr:MAG: hypothetical protein CVV02_14215 [Firmicutes bacterium HGW-Firmicutes-7]
MNIKNKRYIRAIIIALIMVLISVELPYSDKAIIQYLIPVINFKTNGVVKTSIFLSGLVPLVGLLWSYREICNSNRFKASRLAIFIVMFVIVVPFVISKIDVIKAPIYYLNSGVKSVEIKDSNLSIVQENNKEMLRIELEAKSYRNNIDGFQIAIVLSDTLENYLENNYILLGDKIRLGRSSHTNFAETVELKFADGYENDDLFYSSIYNDDYKLILIDQDNSIELRRNDTY